MNNLTQAITIHSAYGVEVEYIDGTILVIDPKQPYYNSTEKTISIWDAINDVEQGKAKLLIHSLDKLTQEIDGKVGIVELAKMVKPNYNWIITDNGICSCEPYYKFTYRDGSFYLKDSSYRQIPNQLELFNYLLEKGYNVLNIPSEFVKEKSEIKERGIKIIDKSKS